MSTLNTTLIQSPNIVISQNPTPTQTAMVPKNKMASSYRPRHKTNCKYNFINNWKPDSITINYTKLHSTPKQLENIIPTPPIFPPTTKATLIKYQKPYKKQPKIFNLYIYYFITSNTSNIHQKPHTITTYTPIDNSYPHYI